MKNWLKSFSLPTPIFIALSLSVLLIAGTLYLLVTMGYYLSAHPAAEPNDRYYLNKTYEEGDPLLTKNPGLKDMLAGPIISSADPSLGESGAPITIVEFADFACDYCFRQETAILQIVEKYRGNIRLVWKDYPDSDMNSISYQAAIAARCAAVQNKFWPYHDRLFSQKGEITENTFAALAASLKLDLAGFNECRAGLKTKQLVADNIDEANALGIKGVPFIYVNDKEVMGEVSSQEIEEIIALIRLENSNQ